MEPPCLDAEDPNDWGVEETISQVSIDRRCCLKLKSYHCVHLKNLSLHNFRYHHWTLLYQCTWKPSEPMRLMEKHFYCWAQPCSWSTWASSWGPPLRYATSLINLRCSLDLIHICNFLKSCYFTVRSTSQLDEVPVSSDFHFMQAFTIVQQCTEYRFYIQHKPFTTSERPGFFAWWSFWKKS